MRLLLFLTVLGCGPQAGFVVVVEVRGSAEAFDGRQVLVLGAKMPAPRSENGRLVSRLRFCSHSRERFFTMPFTFEVSSPNGTVESTVESMTCRRISNPGYIESIGTVLEGDGSIVQDSAASYCVTLGPPIACSDEIPF